LGGNPAICIDPHFRIEVDGFIQWQAAGGTASESALANQGAAAPAGCGPSDIQADTEAFAVQPGAVRS
jgi:hypothetical protein